MQIKSFETVIKFTKAKLTRNRRQSRSASGNREALEEAEEAALLHIKGFATVPKVQKEMPWFRKCECDKQNIPN
jgi:hypothetical protein